MLAIDLCFESMRLLLTNTELYNLTDSWLLAVTGISQIQRALNIALPRALAAEDVHDSRSYSAADYCKLH